MSLQPVLIAGEWRTAEKPAGSFQAVNPAAKSELPESYPVSGDHEVRTAIAAGAEAAAALRSLPAERIAAFLETFADGIEARAEALSSLAHTETALAYDPRLLSVELPRTNDQLRQAARAAHERSWRHATIDSASNIRSHFGPLGGPVVVFGPNNFPFAFNSVAGGDFAAAIAAGNPVIAKANTGHPGTTKLLTEVAHNAVQESGLPPAMVQLLYRTPPEVGLMLVSHPATGATGFTGSRAAGLRLKEAADRVGKPIYLEMSSVNPVFVLPGALQERSADLAAELFGSCALGAGQFCTNPGLAVVQEGPESEPFARELAELFAANAAGTLLSKSGPGGIAQAIDTLVEHGAEVVTGGRQADTPGYAFENTLLRVSGDAFVDHAEALQTEAFGTVTLLVVARDRAQLVAIASSLEGNLTGGIYSHSQGQDDDAYNDLEPVLRQKVGRLLNDKMPTGVAVVPAMNHGGPFPATGHPGFTAVGVPASLLRFGALHCYDNVRQQRLPPDLQDANPTGAMWRLIDGNWSQGDVTV